MRADEAKQLRKGDQVRYQEPDPPFPWYPATVDSVEVLPDQQVVVSVYVPALQTRRYRSCGRLSWWIGWLSRPTAGLTSPVRLPSGDTDRSPVP
jgi:hypothetical protein